MELFFITLLMLFGCHFLADFPLQGDFMARAKDPRFTPVTMWPIVLFGHGCIHALYVLLITKSLSLALFQLVSHCLIDYAKCNGFFSEKYGFVIDQAAHLLVLVITALIVCNVV